MNRRNFIRNAALCATAFSLSGNTCFASSSEKPQIAITIDDFHLFDTSILSAEARNLAILDALEKHNLKAGAFVTGSGVDGEKNLPLLRVWNERGHMIANHTYSHDSYHETDFGPFSKDVLRNEALLKQFSQFRKFFRFPQLKEGDTVEKRDRMRAFLKAHGYRNGHVTIDASDWYINGRLGDRLKNNPKADVTPYRDYYLNHIWERAGYYEGLSQRVLGRSVKHTLLIHHNVLNGLFLVDLLQMFVRRGWQLVDAEEAFGDAVFRQEPNVVPAGESILWSLAKVSGRFKKELRYPAESGEYEKARMDALGL